MSAPVVAPATRPADTGRDRLFHFACSLHRAAAYRSGGSPVRCLCGTVQTRSYPSGLGPPPAGLRCVVCADLAPAHLAACPDCLWAVTR